MSAARIRPRALPAAATVVAGLLCVLVGFAVIPAAAWAEVTFPSLTGRVVDEADLLVPSEEQVLTQALAAHEQASGQQVVVVTVPSLQGLTIEDFGYQLGRHWGIGEEGEDTGALLIVAPEEREVRIEVGYGLEGELTDAASKLIIENVLAPEFRAGRFGPGIIAGTGAILQVLGGEPPGAVAQARQPRREERSDGGLLPLIPMLFFGAFLMVSRGGFGRRRRRLYGGVPWYGGGFGGPRGGGGFGGGGFSGGGGGFGGGGASGSW